MARCSEKGCKNGATERRVISKAGESVKSRPVCKNHFLSGIGKQDLGVTKGFYDGFRIVIANGPPGAGKDTTIEELCEGLSFKGKGRAFILSYKRTLYKAVAKRWGLDVDYVQGLNEDRGTKEVPMECFGGLSVREALISESEDHIKAQYGEDGVARITIDELLEEINPEPHETILLLNPDGGFNAEADYIKERLGLTDEQLFVIRLLRKNCSFQNDSREFLRNPRLIIHNEHSKEWLSEQVVKPVQKWLDE